MDTSSDLTVDTVTKSPPRSEASERITRSPVADEDLVNPSDSHYFHFFLSSMTSILPYTVIFPSIVVDVFTRSVLHKTLRSSVLSISSMVADHRLQRSMDRFYIQYGFSLKGIQLAIQQMSLDEGITISVFLILWIDVVRAELRSSRKHLRGLYLLIQELQKRYRQPKSAPGVLVDRQGGVGLSPLIMQIWRIAIRLDFTTSLYLVQPPVFPPIPPEQQDLHRHWINLSTPNSDTAEWALAAFAQDNLMHRACHVASQSRALRKSPSYRPEMELEIQSACLELDKQNRDWHQRRVVIEAESVEQAARFSPPSPESRAGSPDTEEPWTFLNYPSYRIVNPFYANLLAFSRATSIYISLVAHPDIGPGPNSKRFQDAVEVCRILAGLGEDRSHTASSKVWIMFLTGTAFGGLARAKEETEWLMWRMVGIVKMFPLMKNAVDSYEKLWNVEGDFWDEMDKVQIRLY